FLGFGVPPPFPSWGRMLQDAQRFMQSYPHLALFPGAAIALVVFSFNMLGDGLRDVLDPRLRGSYRSELPPRYGSTRTPASLDEGGAAGRARHRIAMNRTARATIKDVARQAGVSVGTVSRVLNGERSVSESIRDAVNQAILDLNYRPSPTARSLR